MKTTKLTPFARILILIGIVGALVGGFFFAKSKGFIKPKEPKSA